MNSIQLKQNILSTDIAWSQGLYSSYPQILFMSTANEKRFFVGKSVNYQGQFKTPDASSLGELQYEDYSPTEFQQIIFDSKTSVLFHFSFGEDTGASIFLAGTSLKEIDQKIAEFEKLLDKIPGDSNKLSIVFWYFSNANKAPMARIRSIVVPTWDDVSLNYSNRVHKTLEGLMTSRPTMDDGKILLWTGEAGTGKTFAIRTLANSWKEWCDFEYIIDPEALLNNSDYMIEAALREPKNEGPVGRSGAVTRTIKESNKWRCLVLEDCGEMIAMDSKEKIGQALSRLLNMADGMLGQGLRIMFLITTNDELGKLHPAVSRIGRCFSRIEFDKLSIKESDAWLARHDASTRVTGSKTLSELYGILRTKFPTESESTKIGFRPEPLVIGPQNI